MPASIACSIAPAIPTVSFGTTTKPSNLPEAIISSICPYCNVALNSPLKISAFTFPASFAAFFTPSQVAWL